MITDRTV